MPKILPYILLAVLACPDALSMQLHSRPLTDVLAQTHVVVVADIQTRSEHRANSMWRSLSITAEVVRVVVGGKPKSSLMQCTYEEGAPHMRGSSAVSPLISGSGIEFDVQAGVRDSGARSSDP